MRICYIIHVFPPESWGGSENYVYMLARQLSGRHEVRIFTRTHRQNLPEYHLLHERVDGLDVFRVNNNFKDVDQFERIYRNPQVDKVFAKFLDDWRPDVVHAHHLTCLSTDMVEVAQRRSIPFVLTIHDFWMTCLRGQRLHPSLRLCETVEPEVCGECLKPWMDGAHLKAISERFGNGDENGWFGKWRRSMMGWWTRPQPAREIERFHRHSRGVLKKVDRLIMTSEFVRQEFLKFGCDSSNMILSDNGIDASLVWPVSPTRQEKITFGFVATLIPSKGAHVLVEAFRRLPSGNAHLKIFGSPVEYEGHPDYFENLKKRAAGFEIEFREKFPIEKIGQVLSEMDVLVVPSIWFENAPLIIRQALLAGIPVIAADRGGMAESVQHEINGLHFKLGDAESLAATIQRLIDDPALRLRLGASKTPVKSIQQNAEDLESIYRSVVRSR